MRKRRILRLFVLIRVDGGDRKNEKYLPGLWV